MVLCRLPGNGFFEGWCPLATSKVALAVSAFTLAAAMSVLPVQVASAQSPSTAVTIPTNNYTVSGTSQLLDAVASPPASQVHYEVTGGTLTDSLVATAIPTYYGWLALWNTTAVPNGSYSLQSVATYSGGVTVTSAPVTITVNNPPPLTAVLVPASGATVDSASTQVFDAVASPGVTQVTFQLTGQGTPLTLAATPTIYGWIATHPGFTCSPCVAVPLQYSIQSVAAYPGGVSGTSAPVNFTIIAYTNQF
jgi:hypothetical protein